MDDEANPHLTDGGPLPEQTLQQYELRALLERALAKLPEDQRMTLLLVDQFGFSYQEVAETMHVRLGTVKSRLARARLAMQSLLQEEGELLPGRYRLNSETET